MQIAATASSQFSLLERRILLIHKNSRVRVCRGESASSTLARFGLLLDQRDWQDGGQLPTMESNHTTTMACVLPLDDDQRQRPPQSQPHASHLQKQQRRHYHSTPMQPILPLIVGCVAVAGGYVVYRKLQGASVVPDEAAQAQEAYRKRQGKFSNTTTCSSSSSSTTPTPTGTSSFNSRENKETTETEESSSQQETENSKKEESKVNR